MARPDIDGFDRLLAPESVAVIGSLSAPEKVGARTVDHLRRAGFPGRVEAVGKVDDLTGDVDVAVVAVPAAAVPDVLGGLRGRATHAVVYSSGFGEAGGERLDRFHDGELRVLGPNTVGLYVSTTGAALAFAQALGPVIDANASRSRPAADAPALVTQSGAFGARITSASAKRNVHLGTFVATGNEDGYTLADVLVGLGRSAVVSPRVVLLYVEAVRDAGRLQHAVAALAEHGTEVVALVGGRSATGARAATSHTAALAADGPLLVEALTAAGATVVDGDRELVDALAALTVHRRASGRRVAVLTGSGGAGVVAADLLARDGLDVVDLGAATRARLRAVLPDFAATANPVDVTASVIADVATLARCAEVLAASGEVDLLVTVARDEQAATVQRAAAPLPTVAAVLDATTDDLAALAGAGVLAAGDLTGAAAMASALAAPRWASTSATVTAPATGTDHPSPVRTPASAADRPTASRSLELVERHGIVTAPWRRASTGAEVEAAASELGWPVVLKADVIASVHKAAAGGVRLDVTRESLAGAARELLATAPAIIVAAQRRGGLELFAGARFDEQFGTVVVAGLGGGYVELLDRTVSLPASTPPDLLAARIEHVAFRDAGPPGTARRLADAALALARLVDAVGADAAECNPMIDTAPGLIALDARVILP